ncbi:hypothetical protein BH09MYX1_BH09MYX1_61940 [soil metagenome]
MQTPVDAGGDRDGRDGATSLVDGSYSLPDAGTIRADRFVTDVVDFSPGDCAGFGLNRMPTVVQGPPVGFGDGQGSTDVLSLGKGGSIVLGFGTNAIVDATGIDFVVFENAFVYGGDQIYADPAEVSVSDDGKTWSTFPCTATSAPYGSCAGWHPAYSSPENGISPIDYPACGGDGFDLADLGVARARFVRIRDVGATDCPTNPKDKTTTVGFDLDAIAIVHAEIP